jgi:hypothetical protein
VSSVRAKTVIALLLAVASWPAVAEPTPTMHRAGAGTLDASGWTDASSTEGHFSIRMPCVFDDYKLDNPDQAAPVPRSHFLVCRRADAVRFMAVRISYRGGLFGAQARFDETGRHYRSAAGTVVTALPASASQGFDAAQRNDHACLQIRMVRDSGNNVLMIVDGPLAACDRIPGVAAQFFAALRLEPMPVAQSGGHS